MDKKLKRNKSLYEYWVSHGYISYAKLANVFHISKARAYQIIQKELLNDFNKDEQVGLCLPEPDDKR
jgi:hypothetical protein